MTIQTDRLVLRPVTPADTEAVLAMSAHPDVRPWLLPGQATDESAREWVERSVAHWRPPSGVFFGYALAWREAPDALIGIGSLLAMSPVRRLGWVGWEVHPEHAGRGVATEAARALLDLGFGAGRMRRIRSECYRDNAASRRVMEKVGMAERTDLAARLALRLSYPDRRPKARYEITRDEWLWRSSPPAAAPSPAARAQPVGGEAR